MSTAGPAELVQALGTFPGVGGCALVDADTGMTWFHSGEMADMERLGEAAVELWRAEARLREHFETLGSLQSAAFSFSDRVVALFPCATTPALVLVCAADRAGMDWPAWATQVTRLKAALAAEFNPTP